jgi:hypothetical protein
MPTVLNSLNAGTSRPAVAPQRAVVPETQIASPLLAQANSLPNGVLSLLRD